MSEQPEGTAAPQPVEERWVYAGLRIGGDRKKTWAWQPLDGHDETAGAEMWFCHSKPGSWVVGGIYLAKVGRLDDGVTCYGSPHTFQGRFEDLEQVAAWEIADRFAKSQFESKRGEDKARRDPALARALAPLCEVAKRTRTTQELEVLAQYVRDRLFEARYH